MDDQTKFEQLKSALFMAGHDAMTDFLGYDTSPDEDRDVTDNRMDQAWMQMPWEELRKFYEKYGISVI